MIEIQAQRVWEWKIGKQGFHKLLKKQYGKYFNLNLSKVRKQIARPNRSNLFYCAPKK